MRAEILHIRPMTAHLGIHACAIVGGAAKCWGRGSFGRLGDGASTDRSAPVDVATLSSGVTAIGAGSRHTCAITSSGGVKCWGSNNVGQLGDNSNTLRAAPVEVLSGPTLAPLSGIVAIAVGNSHTCALTSGGGVKCWGFNGYGQLGDGSYIGRLTPGDVPTLTSGVSAIAAGDNHTCALISGGGVKCWGAGSSGQLGDNLNTDRNTPQQVLSGQSSSALGGITAISAAGSHTCTVTTGSGIKCWGGQSVTTGNIILRQCGSKFKPGRGVGLGRDFTLFALLDGKVVYRNRFVDVIAAPAAPAAT